MSFGFRIFDAAGNVALDMDSFTFVYIGEYTFTPGSSDVIISTPGTTAATHFAITAQPGAGFPVVETDQIRVKRQFFGGATTATVYLFRI